MVFLFNDQVSNFSVESSFTDLFNHVQQKMLYELKQLPAFKGLESHVKNNKEEWKAFLKAQNPEDSIPNCWTILGKDKSGLIVI